MGELPFAAPPPEVRTTRAPHLTADQKVRVGMSCECARRAEHGHQLQIASRRTAAARRAALDLLAAIPRPAPCWITLRVSPARTGRVMVDEGILKRKRSFGQSASLDAHDGRASAPGGGGRAEITCEVDGIHVPYG